jgi:hypothetical protein
MYESVVFTIRKNVQILQKKTHYIFDKLKYVQDGYEYFNSIQGGVSFHFIWSYQ